MNLENPPATPATNGEKEPLTTSRLAAPSRLPRPRPWGKRRTVMTVGLLSLLCVGAVALFLWWTGALFGKSPFTGDTWTVRKERLQVTIVARGSLESAKNRDIYCKVRSGTKGSTNATVIKDLKDAGTEVKEGEILMVLDDSGFKEQLKDKQKDVDNAYADKVKADQDFEIQKLDNESAIESAINVRELAAIDLKKYQQGDFIQALEDVNGRIETAESDLKDWRTRAAWSVRMTKKGLMSKVQADADAGREDAARINLAKLKKEKEVLEKYTKDRTEQDLTAKLAEAKRGVKKAELQADAKLKQAEAKKKSQQSIYEQELSRKKDIEDQIAECIVRSPQDGMVVYYVPAQVRGGGGQQQSIVAQGEPVREGQKMLQIPDLRKMLVNVRVPEALVSHLHSADPDDPKSWQLAHIKVDAFPSRMLRGHVKMVDTVASTQDWFASDVKIYKTLVAIDADDDQPMPDLKPDMSAEVTINAVESSGAVLVVPVQTVVGTISMGAERKVFVVGPDRQPVLRDVVVGMSNERLVEIKSGLKEGEMVVQNPLALLREDSEMKPAKLRKSVKGSGEEGQGGGSGDYGGKKDGMKGGGKKKGPGAFPGGPAGPGVPAGPGGPNGLKGAGAWLLPPARPWRELPAPALHLAGRRSVAA